MPRRWRKDPSAEEPSPGNPSPGRPLPFEITPLVPERQAPAGNPPAPAEQAPTPPAVPPAPPLWPRTAAPRAAAPRRDRSPLITTQIPPARPPLTARADPPSPEPALPGLPDTLVRFAAVTAALAFAGATANTAVGAVITAGWGRRPPPGYRCRISRLDGSVWVGLGEQADASAAAELAAALGGTVIRFREGRPEGTAGSFPVPEHVTVLEPVPLLWLASTLMPAGPPSPLSEVAVVTTGRLAGPIVRRWQRSLAEVTISELSVAPIGPHDPVRGTRPAVLVRVASRDGRLPQQAIAALTDLPHTVVCRVADRLLIDVRFALPADDRQLAAEIPVGETWIAGGVDAGLWRIASRGAEVTAPSRLAFTVPVGTGAPGAGLAAQEAPASLAPGAPVRVVPARRPDGSADAMLLDDLELDRLRRFLSMSPLAETAFIVPGPGRHLLTEPAGLLTAVPFGVPVGWIGPGGLYVEAGYELDPPVPSTARRELFQLDRDSIVVLCHNSACRLALSGMVPAWRLWLGEAPEPDGGISERGRQLLAGLAPAAPVSATLVPAGPGRDGGRAGMQLDRGQLLIEAEQLEQRGELAGAARRLEEVGELYRAAVLYQRAAREASGRG
jgi:FtsH ternary system domain X7